MLAIDDCEFIDNQSWEVFNVLFETRKLFIVATISREKLNKSPVSRQVLSDTRVKMLELQPIPRLYLGALACQILDVYAISPELEKYWVVIS